MSIEKVQRIDVLPYMSAQTPVIGMRDLQRMSSTQIESLKENGPIILCSNGIKKAVLVNFEQFMLMQNRFDEMLGMSSKFLNVIPRVIPQGYELEVERLKLEVQGTLKKIVAESPELSPLASMLDTLLNLGNALMGEGLVSKEINEGLKENLEKNSKKIGKRNVQSFRVDQE